MEVFKLDMLEEDQVKELAKDVVRVIGNRLRFVISPNRGLEKSAKKVLRSGFGKTLVQGKWFRSKDVEGV